MFKRPLETLGSSACTTSLWTRGSPCLRMSPRLGDLSLSASTNVGASLAPPARISFQILEQLAEERRKLGQTSEPCPSERQHDFIAGHFV